MEPIYAPHFGSATRRRRLKREFKRWQLQTEILDDAIKFLLIATGINMIYHSERILHWLGGLF